MDKTKTEDSMEQPKEDSTTEEEVVEQPTEDSQEQPKSESEEGEEQSEEEATEENEDDDLVELPSGEKVPVEELMKGYMRQSDYTRKMQEVSKMRKDPETIAKQTELSEEEKTALSTLERLGVARKGEVEETVRKMMAQQAIMNERMTVQATSGLDDDSMDIAQFIAFKRRIPLTQAARQLTDSGKKIVKRKMLSPSSGGSNSIGGKGGKEITPEYIKSLDPNSKEFAEVVNMYEQGKI